LQAGQKQPGGNQAAFGQARGRCFYVPKSVQRHPASARATSCLRGDATSCLLPQTLPCCLPARKEP
jgi:hypothetical protein